MRSPRTLAGDLAPRPRAGWEGWFFIWIGAPGERARWCKTHVFRGGRGHGRRKWKPLAAVEGLDVEAETMLCAATREQVHLSRVPAREVLRWHGEKALSVEGAVGELALAATFTPRDRVSWIELPGVLRYVGWQSTPAGTIVVGDETHPLAGGLGVVEHAAGASVPFAPRALVRGPWHWDVLHLTEPRAVVPGGAPLAAAGLWVSLPLAGSRGVRGAGRLPGAPFSSMRPGALRVLAWNGRTPVRWTAVLAGAHGELRYQAIATTPVASLAPGSGFLGFDFEGTWRPRSGRPCPVSGSGFCEAGGPTRSP